MFSDAAADMVLTSASRRPTTSDPRAITAKYNVPRIVDFVLAATSSTVPAAGAPEGGIAEPRRVARYKRVALQFPDELLSDCVLVVEQLREALKAALMAGASSPTEQQPAEAVPHVFVLADTTFASCCPDEITAQHYHADAIVHFGYACMSKSTRLPVLYVHHAEGLDVATTVDAIGALLAQSVAAAAAVPTTTSVEVVVFVPPALAEHAVPLCEAISRSNIVMARPTVPLQGTLSIVVACTVGVRRLRLGGSTEGQAAMDDAAWTDVMPDGSGDWTINGVCIPRGADREATASTARCHQRLLYIGHATDPHVAQLCMLSQYWLQCVPHDDAFLAELDRLRTEDTQAAAAMSNLSSTNALMFFLGTASALMSERAVQQRLRQRMFNVEALKGASSIGILVASLSIEGYQQTAEVLKHAVRAASSAEHPRRAYIIYVGHLNEFKVNNFVDSIDCFVAIACPNSKECHFPTKQDGFLKPVASPSELLIALGALAYEHPYGFTTNFRVLLDVGTAFIAQQKQHTLDGTTCPNREDAGSSALIRSSGGALTTTNASSTAIQRLYERSYVGLEQKLGETAVQATIDEGRQGIARGYKTERVSQNALLSEQPAS